MTFNTLPSTPIEFQSFKKSVMLLFCPSLTLLSDSIRLPSLLSKIGDFNYQQEKISGRHNEIEVCKGDLNDKFLSRGVRVHQNRGPVRGCLRCFKSSRTSRGYTTSHLSTLATISTSSSSNTRRNSLAVVVCSST